MNINDMNDENIFIGEFIFNRKHRVLRQAQQITQLRKKEADVLALLCQKYPNPVSQDDFLTEVWGGGYVTSQSIAQVIRALRLYLGDEKKRTISTISKLGYKLTISPNYKEAIPSYLQHSEIVQVQNEREDFSFMEQQSVINVSHSANFKSIIPYPPSQKRNLPFKKLIISTIILIFGSLACVTLSAGSVQGDLKSNPNHDIDHIPLIKSESKNIIREFNGCISTCMKDSDSDSDSDSFIYSERKYKQICL